MPPDPPAAKRACAAAGVPDPDRLSDLPDGLLHAVLSRLPAPQAVRTCVLSPRWRDLWRTAPCVSIDQGDFGIPGDDIARRWREFEGFATNLLLFRSGDAGCLDTFRVRTRVHCLRDVNRWVRRGIRYCPRALEVQLTSSAVLYLFPPLGPSARRLRRLILCAVDLDARFAEKISSGCPVLEELRLRMCRHGFQAVTCSTLKKLAVHSCANLSGQLLVITAPRLEHLQLNISYDWYSSGISVCGAASLLTARICLQCGGTTFSWKNQRRLLVDLCNVRDLELTGFQTKAMLNEESHKLPAFHNMKTLFLVKCFLDNCNLKDKLEALGTFLQNAPCLEKLTLKCCMFEVDSETDGEIVRRSISLRQQGWKTVQCERLKFVELIYEADHDNKLIELSWGIGKMLPNAIVILTNSLMA